MCGWSVGSTGEFAASTHAKISRANGNATSAGWDNSRSSMQCRWDALLKDVSVRISPDGKEHGTTAR